MTLLYYKHFFLHDVNVDSRWNINGYLWRTERVHLLRIGALACLKTEAQQMRLPYVSCSLLSDAS